MYPSPLQHMDYRTPNMDPNNPNLHFLEIPSEELVSITGEHIDVQMVTRYARAAAGLVLSPHNVRTINSLVRTINYLAENIVDLDVVRFILTCIDIYAYMLY